MKKIPLEVKGRDFWIVLLKRFKHIALYLNKSDGYFAGFEVHIIRRKPQKHHRIKNKQGVLVEFTSPEREVIARNEEFGHYAWSYPDLETVYKNYPIFEKHDNMIRRKVVRDMGVSKW